VASEQQMSDERDEEGLLRRIRAGDEAAWRALHGRYRGPLFRFALGMSGSTSAAEDVVQDVFMSLIRNLDRIDPNRGSLGAYLYGATRMRVWRENERRRRSVPLEDAPERASGARGVDDSLLAAERVGRLREELLALAAPFREALVLCDLEEMSYADAARILGVPVGTLRSRLHRGRQRLAERLRSEDNAERRTGTR